MQKLLACVSLVAAATAAWAQSPRAEPVRPAPAAQKPAYESAFAGYRPWVEQELLPWRAANDEVGRLPAHGGHAKPAPKAPATKERK